RSALLVALAAGAPGVGMAPGGDHVAALVRRLRGSGWSAVGTEASRPTVMARLAAGLLLLDRRDAAGRQLFERARAALAPTEHGDPLLPGDQGSALDGWIGTAALAIAARQLDQDELADRLARAVARRLYLGMESTEEAAFWLLAASAYGVFGALAPAAVQVAIDGAAHRLELAGGVGVLPLPAARRARVIVDAGQPVLARVESRAIQPARAERCAGLTAQVAGHVGHVGDTAALELVVESLGGAVARPVVEVLLPSAAAFPEAARLALAGRPGVQRVDPPDGRGLLRVHLWALGAREQRRLPLPLRWLAAGVMTGPALAAYDADRPWCLSAFPSPTLTVGQRPEERWR
ncbi:MAG TPA: hypothetical protein VGQ83_42120, partial [Polyangia bacterium]